VEEEYKNIYTKIIKAGKRTYFIDVKDLVVKNLDHKLYYIVITESVNVKNSKDDKDNKDEKKVEEYKKYKIKLLPEDFNKFMNVMSDVINHIKTDLMPEFDYDKYN
jgi:hypothetical protein